MVNESAATGLTIVSNVWNWGDGSQPTSPAVDQIGGSALVAQAHTYSSAGTYTLTVTVDESKGASYAKSESLVVTSSATAYPPDVAIESMAFSSPLQVSINGYANVDLCGGSRTNAQIDFTAGDGQTAHGGSYGTYSFEHTYDSLGTYVSCVSATDSVGLTTTKCERLVMTPWESFTSVGCNLKYIGLAASYTECTASVDSPSAIRTYIPSGCIAVTVRCFSSSSSQATKTGRKLNGSMSWSSSQSSQGSGAVVFNTTKGAQGNATTCTLSSNLCQVNVKGIRGGDVSLSASYSGDSLDLPSVGTYGVPVLGKIAKFSCQAALSVGQNIACRASMTLANNIPSGEVDFSQSGRGSVSFSPANSCQVAKHPAGVRGDWCEITITGKSFGPLTLKANYIPDTRDANNLPSSGTVSILVANTTVTCHPSAVVVGGRTRCAVNVIGNHPTGPVYWSPPMDGQACQLSSTAESCKLSFYPSSVSKVNITAEFSGDSYNPRSSGSFSLSVLKYNSTTTVRSCKTAANSTDEMSCTAVVRGYHPSGNVTWGFAQTGGSTNVGNATFTPPTCTLTDTKSGTQGSCSVTLKVTQSGDLDISAIYIGDQNNNPSLKLSLVHARMKT